MKRLSVVRSAVAVILGSVLVSAPGQSQSFRESRPTRTPVAPLVLSYADAAGRAFPTTSLGNQYELKYLGSYSSDGKFRRVSTLDRMFARSGRTTPYATTPEGARPSEVPPSVQLGSAERRVEDLEPPRHAVATAKRRSGIGEARDKIATLVYGRENVMRAPRHLTTDSKQRLIVSDPGIPAVHVLDPKRKMSFRIVAGEGHRLLSPSGTAVDSQDNIYVADSERGKVLVYSRDGVFLRDIGVLAGGEGLFHRPTSIALDRTAGRLYVLDSPRLFMLDLEGNVLQRVGKLRGDTGPLENPTDLALTDQELLVVDASGTRVQIMDLQCHPLRKLSLSHVPISEDIGMGVDAEGNIYVSFARPSMIRVYNHDGAFLGSVGQFGIRSGEFNSPTGLLIDTHNRIYVADTNNVRVQVFQLGHLQP